MTEEKGVCLGSPQVESQFEIHDEAPHDHFASIPNLVDDMQLSPHAYRLYGHLKRVAGEHGKCWQSTETLAKACRMSAGKVSEAKAELEGTTPPLIRIVSKKKDDGRLYHDVFIQDIWTLNHKNYTGDPVHIVNPVARSYCETDRSYSERKKNPLIQEEPSRGEKPKKPDILDGMLELQGKNEQIYKSIAERLEVGLRRNEFPQTLESQRTMRWIAEQEWNGQSLDQFIRWATRDERAMANSWVYFKDPANIRRDWPQAFSAHHSDPRLKPNAGEFYG